jgi:hypothetical protein
MGSYLGLESADNYLRQHTSHAQGHYALAKNFRLTREKEKEIHLKNTTLVELICDEEVVEG